MVANPSRVWLPMRGAMMVAVSEPKSGVSDRADVPFVVADRLEEFGAAVLAGAMNRPVQLVNGGALDITVGEYFTPAGAAGAGCSEVA